MSAIILPFPSVCRPYELANIVRRVAEAPGGKEQNRLVDLMIPIAKRMQRARVGEAEIRRDLAALEAAVWSRVSRHDSRRGGGR